MDVLTDALAALRTGATQSSRVCVRSPWHLYFPEVKGAGFHVVLTGSCWLVPPDGDPLRLGPGDVAFLHRGHGHALTGDPAIPLADLRRGDQRAGVQDDDEDAEASLLCGWFQLDHGRPHPLLRDLPEVIHVPAAVGRHTSMRAIIDVLGTELAEHRPGADAVVPALVDTLLLYILRTWIDGRAGGRWSTAFDSPPIAAALESMHAAPAHPWTVEELGRRVGMSRAVFARRFTTTVGEPPLTYLTRWRLRLAARLLRESDLPLNTIATRGGYTSQFAFAKSFKREYGTPPGRYRTQ